MRPQGALIAHVGDSRVYSLPRSAGTMTFVHTSSGKEAAGHLSENEEEILLYSPQRDHRPWGRSGSRPSRMPVPRADGRYLPALQRRPVRPVATAGIGHISRARARRGGPCPGPHTNLREVLKTSRLNCPNHRSQRKRRRSKQTANCDGNEPPAGAHERLGARRDSLSLSGFSP